MKRKRSRHPLQSIPVNHRNTSRKAKDATSVASSKASSSSLPMLDDSEAAFLTNPGTVSSHNNHGKKRKTAALPPRTSTATTATAVRLPWMPFTSSSKTPKISNVTLTGKRPPDPPPPSQAALQKQKRQRKAKESSAAGSGAVRGDGGSKGLDNNNGKKVESNRNNQKNKVNKTRVVLVENTVESRKGAGGGLDSSLPMQEPKQHTKDNPTTLTKRHHQMTSKKSAEHKTNPARTRHESKRVSFSKEATSVTTMEFDENQQPPRNEPKPGMSGVSSHKTLASPVPQAQPVYPTKPRASQTPKSPDDMDTDESSSSEEENGCEECEGGGAMVRDQDATHLAREATPKQPREPTKIPRENPTRENTRPVRKSSPSMDEYLQGKADNPDVIALMLGTNHSAKREKGKPSAPSRTPTASQQAPQNFTGWTVNCEPQDPCSDDMSEITVCWKKARKKMKKTKVASPQTNRASSQVAISTAGGRTQQKKSPAKPPQTRRQDDENQQATLRVSSSRAPFAEEVQSPKPQTAGAGTCWVEAGTDTNKTSPAQTKEPGPQDKQRNLESQKQSATQQEGEAQRVAIRDLSISPVSPQKDYVGQPRPVLEDTKHPETQDPCTPMPLEEQHVQRGNELSTQLKTKSPFIPNHEEEHQVQLGVEMLKLTEAGASQKEFDATPKDQPITNRYTKGVKKSDAVLTMDETAEIATKPPSLKDGACDLKSLPGARMSNDLKHSHPGVVAHRTRALLGATPPSPATPPKCKPTLTPKSSLSDSKSPSRLPLWTAELSGFANVTPVFRLCDGREFRHTPLPPGWTIKISKSRCLPYYRHPDLGSTFYPPVPLPSSDGRVYANELVLDIKASTSPQAKAPAFEISLGLVQEDPLQTMVAGTAESNKSAQQSDAASTKEQQNVDQTLDPTSPMSRMSQKTSPSQMSKNTCDVDKRDTAESTAAAEIEATARTEETSLGENVSLLDQESTTTKEALALTGSDQVQVENEESNNHDSSISCDSKPNVLGKEEDQYPEDIEVARFATRETVDKPVVLKLGDPMEEKQSETPFSKTSEEEELEIVQGEVDWKDRDSPLRSPENQTLAADDNWGDSPDFPLPFPDDDDSPQAAAQIENNEEDGEAEAHQAEFNLDGNVVPAEDIEDNLLAANLSEQSSPLLQSPSATVTTTSHSPESTSSPAGQHSQNELTPGHQSEDKELDSVNNTSESEVDTRQSESSPRSEVPEMDADVLLGTPDFPLADEDDCTKGEDENDTSSFHTGISSLDSRLSRVSFRVINTAKPLCSLQNVPKLPVSTSTKKKKEKRHQLDSGIPNSILVQISC